MCNYSTSLYDTNKNFDKPLISTLFNYLRFYLVKPQSSSLNFTDNVFRYVSGYYPPFPRAQA
jgi:hypothetical protein